MTRQMAAKMIMSQSAVADRSQAAAAKLPEVRSVETSEMMAAEAAAQMSATEATDVRATEATHVRPAKAAHVCAAKASSMSSTAATRLRCCRQATRKRGSDHDDCRHPAKHDTCLQRRHRNRVGLRLPRRISSVQRHRRFGDLASIGPILPQPRSHAARAGLGTAMYRDMRRSDRSVLSNNLRRYVRRQRSMVRTFHLDETDRSAFAAFSLPAD
jgi:hypothetical protein